MIPPIVIDVNLSPEWVPFFAQSGIQAVYWPTIGAPNASDQEIFDWAHANRHVVFTHDLDFGTLLAFTRASGPSVIQIRSKDTLPEDIGSIVISAITQESESIKNGALLVVERSKLRIRVLPLN